MANCLTALVLMFLVSGFVHTVSQLDPNQPIQVVLKPLNRAVHVEWKAPIQNLSLIDSYRVRIHPFQGEDRKVVFWVPAKDGTRKTVPGLKPNTQYLVQVLVRFHSGFNISHPSSDLQRVITLSEEGFLQQIWAQRIYVMIGAIIMALIVLFFTPCVCCCLARKRRRRSHDVEAVDRKTLTRPSDTEMEHRCGRPSDGEERYTKDPVQGLGHRIRSTFSSLTNQRSPSPQNPPPSYLQLNSPTSFSVRRPAPPPPLPPPVDEGEYDSDQDEYQNDVFMPDPDDLYVNAPFSPRGAPPDDSIYGNV